jgi:hypothetical protein
VFADVTVLAAAVVAFARVTWYSWPDTAVEPAVTAVDDAQVPSYSWMLRVPFSGVLPVAVTVAASLGSQFCALLPDVVSVTRKHSPCELSLEVPL